MKYMGSKNRIAKHILPIMLKHRTSNMTWVEPFVGGGNMIDKVGGERIGSDVHKYIIALLIGLQNGEPLPNEVSKEMYIDIKDNPENFPSYLVGFVGFLCSFGSKWFGGYAKNKRGTNYAIEGRRNLIKQANAIQGVQFLVSSYDNLNIPPNSLIYCDPPYANTTKYKGNFNHDDFWEWCRSKKLEGHTIFISEYSAPKDFECVWSKEVTISMDSNNDKRIEKLFTI